tara:strand:+ start:1208 stop:2092 length:885 start_codon:yes stop_codon:yes gene_type:complete
MSEEQTMESAVATQSSPTDTVAETTTEQPQTNLLNEGATIASAEKDWLNDISEEFRSTPSISNAKNINDIAKQVVNLEKVLGKPKVSLPQENWQDSDWNEFYNKTGRPETIDGYDLSYNSEHIKFEDSDKNKLAESFHKAGLSQQQASAVFTSIAEREANLSQSVEEKFIANETNAREVLQKEWGDDFETNLKLSNAALNKLLPNDVAEQVQERYGNDPNLIQLLANAGKSLMDDTEFKGTLQSSSWTSPVAAKSELDQLRSDPVFTSQLTNKTDPGHKFALEKWTELHRVAAS